MPKLKRLSGAEVIKIFASFGFEPVAQRGSHVKLRRILSDGIRQSLTIPNHSELDTGTLRAIFRQALRYLSDDDLRSHFYTE
ncbi:MAG: type II toxin-antitoxin system HicA family toxin [Pyrinomonadaceae bacterium]